MSHVTLDPESVELIARRVAELLHEPAPPAATDLVDAAEVASRFGVTAEWVREHADQLGVTPLGDGPRPRLRFDLATVAEALGSCSAGRRSPEPDSREPERAPPRRRRGGSGTGVDLLPVRGDR